MKYFVCEIQDKTMTPYAYDELADAQEKFFNILQYAVKSTVAHHGAIIIDNNGTVIDSRFFNHEETEE